MTQLAIRGGQFFALGTAIAIWACGSAPEESARGQTKAGAGRVSPIAGAATQPALAGTTGGRGGRASAEGSASGSRDTSDVGGGPGSASRGSGGTAPTVSTYPADGAAGEGGVGGQGGRPDEAPGGEGGEGGEGSDAGAAGDGKQVGLMLTRFAIDPNLNMNISCFVSWKTNQPATSEVDFGEGAYAFRIRDATLVTDHHVLVIGMHAETAYMMRATSSNQQGEATAEGTFNTGPLPHDLPVPTLTASDSTQSQPGWTLTNIQASGDPPFIVMYDEQGLPVWYFMDGVTPDIRGDVSTQFINDTVVIGPAPGDPAREVDLSGHVTWNGPPPGEPEQNHCASKTTQGTYLVNFEVPDAVQNAYTTLNDQLLEELTPNLNVVWSWRLLDHIPHAGSRREICHGNALQVDEAGGFAYYNCRWLGLFKIDRASGDIAWRIGGTFDTTTLGPGDFSFIPADSQFSDTHDPELHADGTLLVYDNGGYNPPVTQGFHSRVIEYQLDQVAKTATRTFEFPGTFPVDDWYKNSWYTPFWGDADRLPNGNVLVTAGVRSASLSTRIFEVTPSGQVVWELTFPAGNGSYRASRISPPPLVEPLQ